MWTSRKEFTLRFPSAAGREHKIDRAGGGFFHGSFIGDGIASIDSFSLVSNHFHRVATGNAGALEIAESINVSNGSR